MTGLRGFMRRGRSSAPAGRGAEADELYAALASLTATVNATVLRTEIHASDRTARMDLGRFADLERAARRATAVVLGRGNGAVDEGRED